MLRPSHQGLSKTLPRSPIAQARAARLMCRGWVRALASPPPLSALCSSPAPKSCSCEALQTVRLLPDLAGTQDCPSQALQHPSARRRPWQQYSRKDLRSSGKRPALLKQVKRDVLYKAGQTALKSERGALGHPGPPAKAGEANKVSDSLLPPMKWEHLACSFCFQ